MRNLQHFFLVILTSLVASPPALAVSPRPATVFFADATITSVEISPDGAHYSRVLSAPGRSDVEIYNSKTHKRVGLIPYEGHRVFDATWVSPRAIMIASRKRKTEKFGKTPYVIDDPEVKAIAIIFDLAGAAPIQLSGEHRRDGEYVTLQNRVENLLPDDSGHVIMLGTNGSTLNVYRVNVTTGETKLVEKGSTNTFDWITDRSGVPVLRFDNVAYTRTAIMAKDETGKWRAVKSYSDFSDEEDIDFLPAGRVSTPTSYDVFTREEGEEFYSLKRFNLLTETYSETLLSAPGIDVGSGVRHPRSGLLLGAYGWSDTLAATFFKPEDQATYERLRTDHGLKGNLLYVSGSDDLSRIIVLESAPNNPGTYHFYDVEQNATRVLFRENATLTTDALGVSEIISYKTSDGMDLSAYVTHPAGRSRNDAAPMVVLVHGGPHARDFFDYDPEVQFLANRGYRIVQPYFRGSSGRGRTFEASGYGEWGLRMQADVDDLAVHFQSQGLAAPRTTCIMGASYGGYAALRGVTKRPDLYACGISINGVSDLPNQLKYDRTLFYARDPRLDRVEKSLEVRPGTASLRERSPLHDLERLERPVLIVHGMLDIRVPIDQAQGVLAALARYQKPHQAQSFQFYGYSGWPLRGRVLFGECLDDFLGQMIGGAIYEGPESWAPHQPGSFRCDTKVQ